MLIMAHITSLKISGLAGRKKDIEIKFNRDVNILFGVNGVGKTTLLKIIHSALENDPKIVSGLPFSAAEVGIYSVHLEREIVRSLKNSSKASQANLFDGSELTSRQVALVQRRLFAELGEEWGAKNGIGDELDGAEFAHEYLPTTRLISVSDMASTRRVVDSQSEEANINNMMEAQLQQQWVKYFSPLQASTQEVQQKGIARILSTVLSLNSIPEDSQTLEPDVAYAVTRKFLSSNLSTKLPQTKSVFTKNYLSDKRLAAVVNQIAIIEKEVDAVRRPKDQLQKLLNSLFLNKEVDLSGGIIKVVFGSEGQKQPLKLSQLSSGEKQALYILIHALRANVNSLIVDEPELSMHIDWQRQIISAIRELNPMAQIIMATHSPEVMANSSDDCIFEI